MNYKGSCHCGRVRFEIDVANEDAAHCHCDDCRKTSGALFVSWITVPASDFRVLRGSPKSYRSSDHGTRRFCADCGAQITFESVRENPGMIDATVGLLEKGHRITVEDEIWTESKVMPLSIQTVARSPRNGK